MKEKVYEIKINITATSDAEAERKRLMYHSSESMVLALRNLINAIKLSGVNVWTAEPINKAEKILQSMGEKDGEVK